MGDLSLDKINVACPSCERRYRVKSDWIGRRIKCKACGNSFPIRALESEPKDKDLVQQQRELIIALEKEIKSLKQDASSSKSELLQTSVDGLDSLLLRIDSKTLIQYANSTFCKTFGIEKEDLIGKPTKTLKSIVPLPIFETFQLPTVEGVENLKVKDNKGKVYEIRKTYNEGYLDLVLNDVSNQQKFQDYVSRYISSDLIDLDESELQTFRIPERRFMSVSFTDLRGFTAMSETLKPEEVRTTMNAYLEEIIHAINVNQATVDKIVGDEVMALYGAPKYYKDHAFRAIKTACDQIRNLKALQKVFSKIGKHIPDCGVGINSGDMVVGNMGSSTHQDYTVLGAAVNLAARLCGAAKGAQVILTEATMFNVMENLPEGWGSERIKSPSVEKNSKLQGKVEAIHPLPEELQGQSVLIGPKGKDGKIKKLYQFDYEYSIKVKGVSDPLPVISVVDFITKKSQADQTLSDTTIEDQAERVFGKFRLIELIGRGGMGEVWKARDPFGNIFAVKTLLSGDAATEQQIKRFKREAKIMAKLNHRGLCKIIEIGEVDKTTYIAMEYIEGATLSEILEQRRKTASNSKSTKDDSLSIQSIVQEIKQNRNEGKDKPQKSRLFPLPEDVAVNLIIDCCHAIEYAHEHGILHRDLKPSNIIIREDGSPVIMDFGLAKLSSSKDDVDVSMSLSVSGEIVGSIEYMSPEQAKANKKIDERTDVYSLGSILYVCLSGKKYFESTGNLLNDIGLLDQYEGKRLNEASKSPLGDLDIIVFKSLRPIPDERYENVNKFGLDLQRYLLGEVIDAKDVTFYEVSKKFLARNKLMATTIATAILLIGILSGYYIIDNNKKRIAAELALQKVEEERKLRLESEKDNAPVWFQAAIGKAKVKKMDEALKHIDKALSLSEHDTKFKIFKGELLIYKQEFVEAIKLFEEINPSDPEIEKIDFLKKFCSTVLLKPNDPLPNYQYQKHLIKEGRPYLARVKNRKLELEAFQQKITRLYPKVKVKQIIDHQNKQRIQIDGLNHIQDLSILQGWPLGTLNFRDSSIENFDILKVLDFSGLVMIDKTVNLDDIIAGKELEYLHLQNVKGKNKNLKSLEKMPLKTAIFEKMDIDLNSIKNNPVEYLELRDIQNLDLGPLKGKFFEQVYIDYSKKSRHFSSQQLEYFNTRFLQLEKLILDDLNFIEKMKDLRRIDIVNCDIHNQEGLKKFKGDFLHLAMPLKTLHLIKDLKLLRTLTFSVLPTQDLNILSKLNLKSLILLHLGIDDLSFINNFQNLEELMFLPSQKNLNWISHLRQKPNLKLFDKRENFNSPVSVEQYIQEYFDGKYTPIPDSLKEKYHKREEIIADIKKDNPKFIENAQFLLTLNDDLEIQQLGLNGYYDNRLGMKDGYDSIENLDFLKKYKVREFNLMCEKIKSFEFLSDLKHTEAFSIYNMKVTDKDLQRIPLNTSIRSLSLVNTEISSLDYISKLNLRYLNIGQNERINSLDPLKKMKSLVSLGITYLKNINDLSPLLEIPVKNIYITEKEINIKNFNLLRKSKTLDTFFLRRDIYTKEDFWKKFDAGEFE